MKHNVPEVLRELAGDDDVVAVGETDDARPAARCQIGSLR